MLTEHLDVIEAALQLYKDKLFMSHDYYVLPGGKREDRVDRVQPKRDAIDAALAAVRQEREGGAMPQGELLPCAHCGGEAHAYDYNTETGMWCVECDDGKCWATVSSQHNQADAIARWNRRPANRPCPRLTSHHATRTQAAACSLRPFCCRRVLHIGLNWGD